jgi:hypothetical protein
MKREQAHVNTSPSMNMSTSQSPRNSSIFSSNTNWTNNHVQFYQAEEMRD